MGELTTEVKNRRQPLLAVVLSIVMPGLGHVYCGRIAKGLVLAFLSVILIPVILVVLSVSHSSVRIVVVIVALLAFLAIWLIAIIDSWRTARHTKVIYVLKDYNRWYVYLILVLMSMASSPLIALNVRSHLIEAFRIPTASMYPTTWPGDRLLANKLAYKNHDPKRGNVVVFICPENRRWNHIKRVVATAGDTVEMRNNDLYVNGQKLERTPVGPSILVKENRKIEGEIFLEKHGEVEYKIFLADVDDNTEQKVSDFAQITVPQHHCFVLGDNRNSSRDSRHYGPIHLGLIKGRGDYLYWPAKEWSRFGRIR